MLVACERDVSIIRIYPGHSWETITTPLKLRITAPPLPYPATDRHKDMWRGWRWVYLMRYLGGVETECVGSFSGLTILTNNARKSGGKVEEKLTFLYLFTRLTSLPQKSSLSLGKVNFSAEKLTFPWQC